MKNEKKELVKGFKAVIEDLLDNYEKYTDEEKLQIKELFEKAVALNKILDKYDVAFIITFSSKPKVLAISKALELPGMPMFNLYIGFKDNASNSIEAFSIFPFSTANSLSLE